jgi:PAS domain S-box-containing protein
MKVLLIEDNKNYAFLVESMLRASNRKPLSFSWADTLQAGIDQLRRDSVDIILADLSLPDSTGLATVTELKNQAGMTPIVVLTGCQDERLAAEALRQGAQDYLLKNEIDRHGLERTIRYAIERQRSEDKYRDLVESLDTIVWEANPDTWQFTFVSNAAEKILGYPIANWLQPADFWLNLIHPDDRSTAVEHRRRQCEVGDGHEFEYRAVAQDGRIVWLRDIVRVARDESGQAVKLRGVMIDISQTKQAAAELQKHHHEIQTLHEISQIILESEQPNIGIQQALEKCVSLGGFDFGDILLTTPEGEFVAVTAACGFKDMANLQRTPRGRSGVHRKEHLRESSITHNILSSDRFRSLKREGAQTVVSVPLHTGSESLGVLQLASRTAIDIQADEMAMFEAIGHQFGSAIQKARLFSEIEKKSQELGALLDVSSATSRSLNLAQMLQEVARKIAHIFDFDATRVLLFDERQEELQWQASFETDQVFSLGPRKFKKGQGISGHAAASGEAIVVENIDTDPRYERLTHDRSAQTTGQKFAASFPIKHEADILGVITCVGRQARSLTDHEMHLIASMSNQIAVAVHNARLYSEVEKQSRELSALFEVTAAATQSLEMDRVLEEVIRRINENFLFDATRFYLFDEQQEHLHCRATHQMDPKFATRTVTFKKGQGITGHVAATGTALIVENTQDNPSYQSLSQNNKGGARFVAGFPVKYGSQTLGVIMCLGEHPRWLSKHEIELIESLSGQIAIAITNAHLYEQTKKQTEQLRSLSTHLETVREQERTRISRELHDELGQALTGLKFDVAWVSARLSDSESSLVARLATMSESLDNTIQTIRQISARLRPDILDKLGLSAAVEWQLQEFRRRSGINYHFNSHPTDIRLHERPSIALFRILQEALTNVARHSQASRVRVAIEQQAQEVSLQVDDNGCGIEDDKLVGGQSLGLLGMRERATSLGGSVTIRRNGEQGTVVTAVIPIQLGSNELDFSPGSQEP